MFSKQKIRKVAWCLLLVALISLIPSNTFKVLADESIVPPFPYDELQTIGDGNSYALFRVHGIDEVDYVEVIAPDANLHGMYQHLLPGLSYSGLGGWVLQINSIAYCFKNGQKVDFDLQSLFTSSFLPVDNDDPYFSCWLEFVYTTEDIYGVNDDDNWATGYGLKFFKAQNFYIEPAATPTPAPDPIKPLEELPTFTVNSSTEYLDECTLVVKCTTSGTLGGYTYSEGHYYASGANYVNNPWYYYYVKDRYNSIYYGGVMPKRINNSVFEVNFTSGLYSPRVFSIGYDVENNIITSGININSTAKCDLGVNSSGYHCYANYFPLDDINTWYDGSNNINIVDTARFALVACNNGVYRGNGDLSPSVPTPTTAPTPIPQPSITPEPDDPDKNSSWGWGIVNALKYIFIPDKNKLIRLEKTTQTKFQQFGGGYDDLKHVSGFVDPVRPQNVVMNWQPFGSDSAEQQQQITLVDFEQIDFYLFQTSSGMFICECLKASFTFLMFGYLIHVIRKHFVIENNSSDENDGGGD